MPLLPALGDEHHHQRQLCLTAARLDEGEQVGHLLGLAHPNPVVEGSQPDALATMVFSLLPNAQQASLAADDKLGLCEKYPIEGGHECDTDDDCRDGEFCAEFEGDTVGTVRLCDESRGQVGDECSKTNYGCAGLCRFTRADFSAGYCTEYCDVHADCPDEWHCEPLPATTGETIYVCEPGPPPEGEDTGVTPVDGGITPVEAPESDAGDVSGDTADLPESDAPADGADAAANDSGTEPETGTPSTDDGGSGGGCAVAATRRSGGSWVLAVGVALALARRRRRR